MNKADLLDELRAEIGVVSDNCHGQIKELYQFVCKRLYEKVAGYQSVSIYLTNEYSFFCYICHGSNALPLVIPFGEEILSLGALHAGVMMKRVGTRLLAVAPFYRGHQLIGELVVQGNLQDEMDDEDLSLFHELATLFERKVKESYY
ncbi:hypothetical protein [Thermoflavimicrobium daqui]|jgi:hypothetical protein|uniref:GAF domain-containing protein n=1 Tax=Thermoflavimicrobium daqui TaxID=2137476 RepID=A0A364K6P4_9BACL|nr:hypothetical protein [Thermoflavimicrobium daqui]RAL25976.1 hypothetical protein DL897_07885 [Thermoflavimicrobium daqui]